MQSHRARTVSAHGVLRFMPHCGSNEGTVYVVCVYCGVWVATLKHQDLLSLFLLYLVWDNVSY